MKKFLQEMVMNPDGSSYSSKRTGGFIALFAFIAFGLLDKPDHIMYSTLGLVASFWGLTSFDYKEFLKIPQSQNPQASEEKG